MNRPVTLPLFVIIVLGILVVIDITVVPWYKELKRDAAVNNINSPITAEHNKLGQLFSDTLKESLDQRRAERTAEHTAIENKTDIIIENQNIIMDNQQIIIQLLKNGTS